MRVISTPGLLACHGQFVCHLLTSLAGSEMSRCCVGGDAVKSDGNCDHSLVLEMKGMGDDAEEDDAEEDGVAMTL